MSNLTVENVYTRHAAKELTKKYFWKLLGMVLIVFVIIFSLGFGGITLLTITTGASVTTTTTAYSVSAQIDPASINAGFLAGYFVLMLLIALVSGGLNLGLTRSMIDICRGDEDVSVGRVFSRMGSCLKVFGLSLWVSLKIVLWALPVYAFILIAGVFLASSASAETAVAAEASGMYVLLSILPLIIMIVMLALVIPAVYRYMLSTYILADEPSTGVFACVRQSKAMMKGHKWQAFKLIVPFFLMIYGWMFVIIIALSLTMAFAGESATAIVGVLGILALIAMIALVLIFTLRILMAYCLFYLKRADGQTPAEESAEEPLQAIEPAQAE